MFISIAVAVALFIFAGMRGKDWDFLNKELCQIDIATADMVKDKRKAFKVPNALLICIGVMLFILWIPLATLLQNEMFGNHITMHPIAQGRDDALHIRRCFQHKTIGTHDRQVGHLA